MGNFFEFFLLVRPKLRPSLCEVLKYKLLNLSITASVKNASIFIQRCHSVDLLVPLLKDLGGIYFQAFIIAKDNYKLNSSATQADNCHSFRISTLFA